MVTMSRNKEHRYAPYHKDGLVDIFIGLGIIFAGLFLWKDLVWLAAISIPVFWPSFQAARVRLLQSRIGKLEYNSQQEAQAQKFVFSATLVLGLLFLAGIGMFFAFDFMSGMLNDLLRRYFLVVLGMIFGSVWVLAGAMLKIARFHLHGVFTFAVLCIAQFAALPFWLALIAVGGLIMFSGFLILIRFLRENPKIE